MSRKFSKINLWKYYEFFCSELTTKLWQTWEGLRKILSFENRPLICKNLSHLFEKCWFWNEWMSKSNRQPANWDWPVKWLLEWRWWHVIIHVCQGCQKARTAMSCGVEWWRRQCVSGWHVRQMTTARPRTSATLRHRTRRSPRRQCLSLPVWWPPLRPAITAHPHTLRARC